MLLQIQYYGNYNAYIINTIKLKVVIILIVITLCTIFIFFLLW